MIEVQGKQDYIPVVSLKLLQNDCVVFFKTNKRFALNDKPLTCMKQGNVSLTTKKLQSNKTVDAGEQLFQTSTCTSINFICFKIKESVLLLTISTNSDHYSRI